MKLYLIIFPWTSTTHFDNLRTSFWLTVRNFPAQSLKTSSTKKTMKKCFNSNWYSGHEECSFWHPAKNFCQLESKSIHKKENCNQKIFKSKCPTGQADSSFRQPAEKFLVIIRISPRSKERENSNYEEIVFKKVFSRRIVPRDTSTQLCYCCWKVFATTQGKFGSKSE